MAKKTKKLPSLKTLRNKLDKTFNAYIRERDKKCILSNKKDHLQCSHYYDYMQNPFLRWDERNAHAMTNKMHFKHHHGKAPDYAHWMYRKYGFGFMEQLYIDSKKTFIPSREFYNERIKYFEEKRRQLHGRKSTARH